MSTKIEWSDETWSPVTGCTKVSEGCRNCYAERMAKRLRGRCGYPQDDPFRVTVHPERLDVPLHWRKPRVIFVCSMSDLFHDDVPTTYIDDVFRVMRRCNQHQFLVLTKRPDRMLEYQGERCAQWTPHDMPGVPTRNIGLGVSVEDASQLWRVDKLLQTPAAMRFVSFEPLLGPVDADLCQEVDDGDGGMTDRRHLLDWIIVGGESGPGARPMHPNWARDLRDQAAAVGVPFFMKQMSRREPIPKDLFIREFPNANARWTGKTQ